MTLQTIDGMVSLPAAKLLLKKNKILKFGKIAYIQRMMIRLLTGSYHVDGTTA